MTSSNALKCVVSDYEKGSPQQKIGNFTQTNELKSFLKRIPLMSEEVESISKNNRKFLGFEIAKEYCEIANKRLEQQTLEVKSGCDANDDGIPPNNKLLGILPNEL